MALGFKSGKVAANNSAVAFGEGYAKLLQISTYGNAGTVYIGGAGVSASTGLAVGKDQILHGTEVTVDGDEEFDLSKIFVFSASTDGLSFLYVDRG